MLKKLAAFFGFKESTKSSYSPTTISLASPPPPPRSLYKIWAIRCQVGQIERYRRPNYDGSIWFEGTTLHVRVVPDMKPAAVSCENLYNFASVGDALNIVYAEQDLMGMKANLPVLVINSNTSGYHLIDAAIEKVKSLDKGGIAQLEKEISQYADRHLKVTFV